jgi:predicted transcriptional regulator
LSSHRSPDMIALELLDCVAEKGEASKWMLIKVLGNDSQFRRWVEGFMIPEDVLVERREGRNYYYTLTPRGELFHRLLKNGNIIRLFSKVAGRN